MVGRSIVITSYSIHYTKLYEEEMLASYAEMLDLGLLATGTPGTPVFPAMLQKRLQDDGVFASIYPADRLDPLADGIVHDLLHQALQSDRLRFRFISEGGPTPSLTVAAPLHRNNFV